MKKIALFNHKGGVGKTTFTVNVALLATLILSYATPTRSWAAMPACFDTSPRNPQAQMCAAIQKFCATATPMACSLFENDAFACEGSSAHAIPALDTVRLWKRNGSTPGQAAELASRAGINPFLAGRAASVPDNVTPQDFHTQVLAECLSTAAE